MDDGFIDLPDNSDNTADTPAGEDPADIPDTSDDIGGGSDSGDSPADLDGAGSAGDETDQEGGESPEPEDSSDTDGQETENTEDGNTSISENETDSGTETGAGEAAPQIDPEVLAEINATLKNHSSSVDGFISSLTVSGNSVLVSFDEGSAALLSGVMDRQDETLETFNALNGLVLLVFFMLVFDLIHRFAKRIIKNFMGGEKNGANS